METLAAEGQASLFLMFAGGVLVILLIGAFWYGSRRRRREAPPAAQNPAAQRREDSGRPRKNMRATRGTKSIPTREPDSPAYSRWSMTSRRKHAT
ncbi:DUF6479 family protein [Streptomyces virginiae]|uniref:DUF6479 family protein n=1 Tax=Streptomyces virginiae TaxID=1961 RepID=UPI003680746A